MSNWAAPTISVCICTRNRVNDLRRCLNSINESTISVHQVIVSDDSTDDQTALVVKKEFLSVSHVQGPRRGLGPNRNCALKEVTGDVIAFLDDDATLCPEFFENGLRFAQVNTLDLNNAILTGVELNRGDVVRSHDQDFLGFQRRAYCERDEINTIVINSAIIPAWLAKKIGFDDNLVYGSDEVDFAIRARAEGIKIIFCPDLKNQHFPSPVNRDYYSPFTEASRLYVTFKRYLNYEKKPWKAAIFIAIASAHVVAASIKRAGPKGILSASRTLIMAYGLIYKSLVSEHDVVKRLGS